MPPAQAKAREVWLAKRLRQHSNLIADGMGDALAEVRTQIRAEIEATAETHRTEMARLLVRVMTLEQAKAGRPVSSVVSLTERGRSDVAA
jgi:hypothetical protein